MWSDQTHAVVVNAYVKNPSDHGYVFSKHLNNLSWPVNNEWINHLIDMVSYGAVGDWDRKIIAPDNIQNTVRAEVRLFRLQDFVEIERAKLHTS